MFAGRTLPGVGSKKEWKKSTARATASFAKTERERKRERMRKRYLFGPIYVWFYGPRPPS
jgi:hypothetical protein